MNKKIAKWTPKNHPFFKNSYSETLYALNNKEYLLIIKPENKKLIFSLTNAWEWSLTRGIFNILTKKELKR